VGSAVAVVALGATAIALVALLSSSDQSPVPVLAIVAPTSDRILFVTTDGTELRHIRIPRPAFDVALSPRDDRLAYSSADDSGLVVIVASSSRGQRVRVTPGTDPAWSPDGQQLAFAKSALDGIESDLFTIRPGTGAIKQITRSRFWDQEPSWSPVGKKWAFERAGQIYVTEGTNVQRLTKDKAWHSQPRWSPDGKQIAFISDSLGKRFQLYSGRTGDVYVMNANGANVRRLTDDATLDERDPRWSSDGTQLAFTVATPGGERSGVAVMSAAGGSPCLVYVAWGQIGGVDWQPGIPAGSQRPARCVSLLAERPAPILACTAAGARTAVDRSQLPLSKKAWANGVVGALQHVCVDFSHDGRADLLVLFDGRGSGGVLGWAAFQRTSRDWKPVLSRNGGHIGVRSVAGDLIETQPVYRKHDANCCPTGGLAHRRYGWDGDRLRLDRIWHTSD
jgi:dipeptidyl aminopeptidase/acylaminoacyl peptidase